ncbi:hypothetical protein GH714_000910 [Hevea brasiliensis]|uniref:XS domain-containing protein n=1 Tax=Hevea brasiliensis TaxID=3981 RepID=A0A6A6N650_HEVBR|nr:hypothetical protein GH714_000910 [Hevea brasiliensis]
MRERRHADIRPGSLPRQESRGRDPPIQENWQFSSSYRSLGPSGPEHDRSRFIRGREEQLHAGDVGTRSQPQPRNTENQNFGGNLCFSGLNWSNDPFPAERGRFVDMGSVQRGECSEERYGQWQKLSGFSETLLGKRRESTSMKFQWDKLLAYKKPTNANTDGNNLGGFRDSDVVPDHQELVLVPGWTLPILEEIVGLLMEGEDEKDLDCKSLNLNPEILQFVAEHGFERHAGGNGSYGDGLEKLPVSYEEFYSTGSSSQRLFTPEEASEIRIKSSLDIEMDSDYQKIMLSCDRNALDEIPDSICGDGDCSYEDIEQLPMLENSRWGEYRGSNTGRMIDGVAIYANVNLGNTLSSKYAVPSKQRLSSKFVKPSKSDIKKRLGPARRSVKQRLGPAPNAGKRLGLSLKVKKKRPWVNIQEEITPENFEQNLNVQKVKSLELEKRYDRTEPPQDSEEFMLLVQSAFLKFVKVLNENSANRRKYLEEGRAGTMKCSICGSSSKEFVDTLSLAQHTFMSTKVGSRSEHLGFHKALCVLMGWNNTRGPNGKWIPHLLPDTEALSLKEDLIIWPPVVLIHNSSISNYNLNERMIVTIEGLKDILRGMGCDRGVTNLYRGKAANQSTMVVSFSGTFSGLREAERLHRLFSEKKHGRAEFQQFSCSGSKKYCQETQMVPVGKVESVLYGYLGIASDLDKLDFEIKKRCVVKSKKDIEAIANASPY